MDETTAVYWLQSRNLTADFRLSPRVRAAQEAWRAGAPMKPAECVARLASWPLSSLLDLAAVEGGISETSWDGELMSWSNWTSFQNHPKWPEPGALRRVGECLIEFAPSGAYVEDWRAQPAGPGPLIGLSLIEERAGNEVRHRGGGLIVCGTHAAFVRGRPRDVGQGALSDQVKRSAGDPGVLADLFGVDAAYGRLSPGASEFEVEASTLPWRTGESLLTLEGFSHDEERNVVVQRCEEWGVPIERRFTVDTLEREFMPSGETPVSAGGRAWFESEYTDLFDR